MNYINKIYGYEIKDIDDLIPYIMHMSLLFTYVYFIFMQCPTDKRFIDICVLLTWPEPSCIANNYTNHITWWHNSSGMKSTCVLMLVSLFQMFKTHTSGMSTVFLFKFLVFFLSKEIESIVKCWQVVCLATIYFLSSIYCRVLVRFTAMSTLVSMHDHKRALQ